MSDALGDEGKQPPRLECPPKWALAPLRAIADVALGKTPGKDEYRNEGKCKIVKYRDLGSDREIDWSNSVKGFIDCNRAKEMNLRRLSQGDVLISASAHSSEIIGRKVLYAHHLPNDFDAIYYVGEILCIRINRNVAPDLPKLLNYFFQSISGYKSIQAKVHGVHLIGSRAAEMIVPVPPEAAQKRIVSKIDELFSRIDEGERALERVSKLLERYRQSVLKTAVTGELTRDWREQHKATGQAFESGDALLTRILTTRREAWEQAELAKMQTKGITPKDDTWKRNYKEPAPLDVTSLLALPQGWTWATADSLCESVHSGTTPERGLLKAHERTGVPFIKVYNLTMDGSLDFSIDPTFVDVDHHQNRMMRSRTLPGDVLTNIVGPPLGKVSLVPDVYPEWNINQAVAGFRPRGCLLNRFLSFYLQSEVSQSWLRATTKTTTSQVNLAISTCRRLPIPVPPLAEQSRICDEVERLLSNSNEAASTTYESMKTSDALKQSVLKAAFEGELVVQDPTDESASVLLQSIALERGAVPNYAAPMRGRKKKSA